MTPLAERAAACKAAVSSLNNKASIAALTALITREMGKVASEAAEEVEGAVDKSNFIDLIAAANEDQIVGASNGPQSIITRQVHEIPSAVLSALTIKKPQFTGARGCHGPGSS
jgi:delta 1-pyrroline-5-carboxylate dehydrogenase